jgi:uncharacterized protein YoxC
MAETILLILSVAFLLLAVFSVPLMVQMRQAARRMTETLEILNRDLPGIMNNLEQITTSVNWTTHTVQREIAELSLTLRRVQGIVGLVLGMGEILRHRMDFPFTRMVTTSLAAVKGVRAFLEVLVGKNTADQAQADKL